MDLAGGRRQWEKEDDNRGEPNLDLDDDQSECTRTLSSCIGRCRTVDERQLAPAAPAVVLPHSSFPGCLPRPPELFFPRPALLLRLPPRLPSHSVLVEERQRRLRVAAFLPASGSCTDPGLSSSSSCHPMVIGAVDAVAPNAHHAELAGHSRRIRCRVGTVEADVAGSGMGHGGGGPGTEQRR